MSHAARPLEARIKRLIAADGPISVAHYMALCLSDPEHGYYATRDPLGRGGDFITAPEVSQMFGEIVGAWLIDVWQQLGAPTACDLIELGPGRGTLMADILRIADVDPGFRTAVRIHLVETSLHLREVQRRTLARSDERLHWHDTYPAGGDRPALVVANEFFDALPVRQYSRHAGRWHERRVGLAGDDLAFVLSPPLVKEAPEPAAAAADGTIVEVSPAGEALFEEIAGDIVRRGGALLLIDYGGDAPTPGGTLQAVRAHRRADPLEAPGTADLTAHVDFRRLARLARARGASVHGPLSQSNFLIRLGLLERAGQLGADKGDAEREAIHAAVERLAGAAEMGQLFKVMAVTSAGLVPEPFNA